MSKLSASLRDSITAEKESIKKKLIPTKAAKQASADQNKPTAKHRAGSNESAAAKDTIVVKDDVTAKKTKSKQSSAQSTVRQSSVATPKHTSAKLIADNRYEKEHTHSKNSLSGLTGDTLSVLLKADVLGKINQNMVQASSTMADIIKECLEAPLISMNEIVNLNTNTSYSLLDRVSNMVNQVSHVHNPFEFWACVNQMVAQSMNNSQNYLKNLSANIHESRTKISGAINKRQHQALERFSNIFTPWKLLAE